MPLRTISRLVIRCARALRDRLPGLLQPAGLAVLLAGTGARAQDVEKPDLKFGFIKLTDCAPLVIAREKGFFE